MSTQQDNQVTHDDFGWWPCACVKGGNWRKRKPSTHIKLNAPSVVKCRKCGVVNPLKERTNAD